MCLQAHITISHQSCLVPYIYSLKEEYWGIIRRQGESRPTLASRTDEGWTQCYESPLRFVLNGNFLEQEIPSILSNLMLQAWLKHVKSMMGINMSCIDWSLRTLERLVCNCLSARVVEFRMKPIGMSAYTARRKDAWAAVKGPKIQPWMSGMKVFLPKQHHRQSIQKAEHSIKVKTSLSSAWLSTYDFKFTHYAYWSLKH